MTDLQTNFIMHSFLSFKYFTAISTIQTSACPLQLLISQKAACVFWPLVLQSTSVETIVPSAKQSILIGFYQPLVGRQ